MAPKTPKKNHGADDGSSMKYPARDPSAGYFAATPEPEVPKLDPTNFSVVKRNFILHLNRTVQRMRFLELRSIIEQTEVGHGHPARVVTLWTLRGVLLPALVSCCSAYLLEGSFFFGSSPTDMLA